MGHSGRLIRFVLAGLVVLVVVVATAGFVHSQTADTGKGPIHDSDVDLSFAEREAKYQADWNQFAKRLAAWMASFDPASVDVRSLEHHESLAMTDDSKPTLVVAVNAADRIVVGHATKLHPDGSNMFGTDVTFEVERTLKGTGGGSITVEQGSTFYPTSDWKGVLIVDRPGEPLMFPGHRYVLFLDEDPRFGITVQLFSGWYELKDGTVHALELNEFRGEVDGLRERDFVGMVEASVQRTSGR